jgi:oxygen-independent coproporphyrinogen-3 oxidase
MSDPSDIGTAAGDPSDAPLLDALTAAPGLPAHFYLHVPFCRSKCAYCDFASVAGADPQSVYATFLGMEAELRRWGASGLPGVVETVYVGGGTPSLHIPQVASLLDAALRELPIRSGAETTVEANPDSLSPAGLRALTASGASRISLGVQAFDDEVLRFLGRPHDARGARAALALVVDAGIEVSVDLMCGIPGQSMASWRESLAEAVEGGARHVSVYPLAVEEGTPLAAAVDAGLAPEPDPDVAAEMMELATDVLGAAGIERYEIANHAARGHRSRHNTAYWTGRSYAGIGPGAHGMLDAATAAAVGYDPPPGAGRLRYAQPADIETWLFDSEPSEEWLTPAQAAREDVMLRLRLVEGVPAAQADRAGSTGALEALAADGLVECRAGNWVLTDRGWLLGNEVFARVWLGD